MLAGLNIASYRGLSWSIDYSICLRSESLYNLLLLFRKEEITPLISPHSPQSSSASPSYYSKTQACFPVFPFLKGAHNSTETPAS